VLILISVAYNRYFKRQIMLRGLFLRRFFVERP